MHRSLKRSTSRATPRALLASVEQRLTRAAGERLRSGTPSCPFEFQAGAWWLSCVVAALASLANYPSRLCCRAQAGIGSRAHGSGGNSSGAHSSALDSHCPREVQVLRRTCQTRGRHTIYDTDSGDTCCVARRMAQAAGLPPFLEETMCLICPCLFGKSGVF